MRILLIIILSAQILFAQERPKVGLVLSGGGAKGLAHIGLLKELEKRGIRPDYITGTSMGALVGGLYAIGYNAEELEKIILARDWDFLLTDQIRRENVLIGQERKDKKALLSLKLDGLFPTLPSGLNTGQNVLTLINILTREFNRPIDFDSLPIPFKCIGTDIVSGEEKIFESGLLAEAMRTSMSIPSVFTPFEIDNHLYVDGGLVNNFPTDVIKNMGADIIIGSDVGANLYQKDEINSIIKILDQSASFHNSRISLKNKALCTIYIRPDISGVSAMDFGNDLEIINRGVIAAEKVANQLDSLIAVYPSMVKSIPPARDRDSIRIVHIEYQANCSDGLRLKSIKRLIKGKLRLDVPATISENELSQKINEVYGSEFFSKVSMKFFPVDSGYNLVIVVDEKTENSFNVGARYDQEYGVDILIGSEFRNLLLYGSLLELKFAIGQSPHGKIRYTTDRGSNIGFGSSFTFDNFNASTYAGDQINYTYEWNRAVWDLFIHSYIGKYNRIVAGIEASMFSLQPIQSLNDLGEMNDVYGNLFISYVVDSWDNAYFPKKGLQMKVRGDLISDKNSTTMWQAWWRINKVWPISKNVHILTEGFLGVGSIEIDHTMFRFETGGMASQRVQWYNSFPGMRFLHHGSNNVWILKAMPRYEFYKNNFLTFTVALSGMDNETTEMFYQAEKFYTGVGLKYSFNSMFGPLELAWDYSFQSYYNHYFISLGYWF